MSDCDIGMPEEAQRIPYLMLSVEDLRTTTNKKKQKQMNMYCNG